MLWLDMEECLGYAGERGSSVVDALLLLEIKAQDDAFNVLKKAMRSLSHMQNSEKATQSTTH
jgi:hypothetical protein